MSIDASLRTAVDLPAPTKMAGKHADETDYAERPHRSVGPDCFAPGRKSARCVPCSAEAMQAILRNQGSGVGVPLAPQHDVRGLLRGHELDAPVSHSPGVDAFEQPFSATEQDR